MLKLIPVILFLFLTLTSQAQINMVVKDDGFLFMEGKDSIFFYQKKQKDLDGKYQRCNYIHPLYGMDGSQMTEDFPEDHPHHRGLFWAWHQILIGKEQISDGWELKNFEQKVSSFEFQLQKGTGLLNATVEWKSPLWKGGSESFLRENTSVVIYPRTGNYRRIDFEIQLNSLTEDLSLGGSADEKGYGGFSARLKLPEDLCFSGENGMVEPANGAVDAGNTLNFNGSFLKNGKKGGVVILNNPQNPAKAANWILRKTASMQNVAFPGRNPIAIPVGKPLVLKYTLLVYQGELSRKQIDRAVKFTN